MRGTIIRTRLSHPAISIGYARARARVFDLFIVTAAAAAAARNIALRNSDAAVGNFFHLFNPLPSPLPVFRRNEDSACAAIISGHFRPINRRLKGSYRAYESVYVNTRPINPAVASPRERDLHWIADRSYFFPPPSHHGSIGRAQARKIGFPATEEEAWQRHETRARVFLRVEARGASRDAQREKEG